MLLPSSLAHVLTLAAVSIFYKLALLVLHQCFEDIASVVLQLFDALPDVFHGSEIENNQVYFQRTLFPISQPAPFCITLVFSSISMICTHT